MRTRSVGGKQAVPKGNGGRDSTTLSSSVTLTVTPLSPKTVTPNRLAGCGPPGKASPALVSFRTPDMQKTGRTIGNGSGGVIVSSTKSKSSVKSMAEGSNAVSSLNSEMDRAKEEFVSHETVGQRVRGGGPTTPVATLKTIDNEHLAGGSSGNPKVSSVTPQTFRGTTSSNDHAHSATGTTQMGAQGMGVTQTGQTAVAPKTRLAASPPTLPSAALHAPLPSPSTPGMRGFVEEMMREEANSCFFDEKCDHDNDDALNLKDGNDFVGSVLGQTVPGDSDGLTNKDEEECEKQVKEHNASLSIADIVSNAVASSPVQTTPKSSKRGAVSRRGGRCGTSSPVRFDPSPMIGSTIGGAPPSPLRSSSGKKKNPVEGSVQGVAKCSEDPKPSRSESTQIAKYAQPRHRPPLPIGLQPRITSVGLSSSCDGTEPSLCSSSSGGMQSTSSPRSLVGENASSQQCPPDTVVRRKRGRNAVGATVLSSPHQTGDNAGAGTGAGTGTPAKACNKDSRDSSTFDQGTPSSSVTTEPIANSSDDIGEKPGLTNNDQTNGSSGGHRKHQPYSITCDASLEATTSPLLPSHNTDASASASDDPKRKRIKVTPGGKKQDYPKGARSPSPDKPETTRAAASGTNRNVTFSPPPPSPSWSSFEKHKKTPSRSPLPGQLFQNLPSINDAALSSPCGIFLSPYSPYSGFGVGAFDHHGSGRGAPAQSAKVNADPVPSDATADGKGTNSDSTDPNASSKEAKEKNTGETIPSNASPRSSPRIRDRGGGVTPTNFANDFVFSWLHSPTGQTLFSPGGLSSATNTPRGMYGFSSFGAGRPRTPRTPNISTSLFFSDVAGFPRDTEFLSPKPPVSVSGGGEVAGGAGGRESSEVEGSAAHQPMICISPLAATKRAAGSTSSNKPNLQRKEPNTPINFRTVFESPCAPPSHGVGDAGSGSTKESNPCSLPYLGDEVPSSTAKSLVQRDDPALAEREMMEDEDIGVLMDLASTSAPRGPGADRSAGRATGSVVASGASVPRQRKGADGSSGTVFRSPRSQDGRGHKRHRSYGDSENPPSSLQIPMMGGRSDRSSPPKQLSRKATYQNDGPDFGEFNPPNISIRPSPSGSRERVSSVSKTAKSTPTPSKKSSSAAKKGQSKKSGSFSKSKTSVKTSSTPIKQTMPNGQKKGASADAKKSNAASKQRDSFQSHPRPINGSQVSSGPTAQPMQHSVPSSHPPPGAAPSSYNSSGAGRQEPSHYGMPRPPSPQRQRQGSNAGSTPGDVSAYGGTGAPHHPPPPPPPPSMPTSAPHPPHGHYQHQHHHPHSHIPPHHHMPQHPSQHPPQHPPHHYHMHSGPGSHMPPYPMARHPPPPHPMAMYGHHPAKDAQPPKGVSPKGSSQKKSLKGKSSKTSNKPSSEGGKGGIATGGKKPKKSGKGGKKPKTAAATAAAAAAAHNPVDRQKAAAAIAAVNAASGGKNDKAAALAAAILRGVTMRPSGKWQAQLYYAGKSRYIGVFDTREKAALAYEIAREVLKSDNKSPADQSAQSLKATETAVNAARKAAFEGVNEKDPRLSSS